jgi:hypothetical protein
VVNSRGAGAIYGSGGGLAICGSSAKGTLEEEPSETNP